jgi:dTDP-glucose 4,6-dehydratase
MKIIVTGGYGFIGSHFVNYVLQNTNDEVVIVDNMTYAANKNNVKYEVEHINKDIRILTEEDLKPNTYDCIVHFAAESHVDNSILNGRPFVNTNVEGTYNLIELARKNLKLNKFLHISTDEVYGDMSDYDDKTCSDETFNIKGSSYYSATKASSDMLVEAAGRTFGLPYLITRTCNNYGENQHIEKFIPKVIRSIKEGLTIPVYGDGCQTREWIHADDNSAAIYKLLISDKIKDVYNIGSGERYKNIDIINYLSDIIGKPVDFSFVEDRLGHDRRYSLNCDKYKSQFGDIKNIEFKEWIKKMI